MFCAILSNATFCKVLLMSMLRLNGDIKNTFLPRGVACL